MKKIILILILFVGTIHVFSQMTSSAPFMDMKVKQAELIFEGKIIDVHSSLDETNSVVKNINYVLVSKQFKGNFISDTVKIYTISEAPGTSLEDDGLPLGKGLEGMFFCVPVGAQFTKWIGINVYYLIGQDGFISIMPNKNIPTKKDFYERMNEIRKAIYDSVEQFTGKAYIKLRLNSLEQNISK
jgi:hypothetical protein